MYVSISLQINTCSQTCNKRTPEEEHGKTIGSTYFSV